MLDFNSTDTLQPNRGGGRIASPAYRQSLALSEDFTGLEEGVDRYELLLLVKRVGKAAGFTPRMISLLDYYLAFTRDVDWEEGSRPIVYQSLARTALDLDISERMVQKLEQALFASGSLTWCDSGNHKRFGQRDSETGRIRFAYGVDLTPLAYLREELQLKLEEKRRYDDAWLETKRQISYWRSQIRSVLAEWSLEEAACADSHHCFEQRYEEIAVQLRTHIDLETMQSLLLRHKSLYSAIAHEMGVETTEAIKPIQRAIITQKTRIGSSRGAPRFAHYKSTTQESFDKSKPVSPTDEGLQESVAEPAAPIDPVQSSGLQHVTLRMAVAAASERFAAQLPHDPTWPDIVEAAARLRPELGISQASWADACQLLGRAGAGLCLLITDQAALRSESPVLRPAAYFRGMVNRGRAGELRLHSSVFGLLKQPADPHCDRGGPSPLVSGR